MDTAATTPRDAALAYRARGWSVLPIEPRGKRPLAPWRELQHERADPAAIDAWFRRWPDANVGIVTGRASGLVVVDVDGRHGGEHSLAALGALPDTVEAATGGGGRHLYFEHPGRPMANRVGLLPGIDLRGDGGCVVAPPSLHPSGRRYAWVAGGAPGERPLAALPAALRAQAAAGAGHTLAHWRALAHDGVAEGARNDTLASLAGYLLWHGVDAQAVRELLLGWNQGRCRPPLPEAEVLRVVDSIARRHEAG